MGCRVGVAYSVRLQPEMLGVVWASLGVDRSAWEIGCRSATATERAGAHRRNPPPETPKPLNLKPKTLKPKT